MEEKVKSLVSQIAEIFKKQTKNEYPDVNEKLKSLQDYAQASRERRTDNEKRVERAKVMVKKDTRATKSGLEDRLKKLEDILSKKNEKKKPIMEHTAKIREAMRLPEKSRPREDKGKHSPTKRTTTESKGNKTPTKSTTSEAKRPVMTQTDETMEVSGTNDQHAEEVLQGATTNEVRFFEERLSGLKQLFNADTKDPLEKIIPPPKKNIREKVKTGYIYLLDVAREINRLKVENKYLRKILEGLHKNLIAGEETPLKELKTPKDIKDDQSIGELETNVKEVTQKFHEMKTEMDYILNRISQLFLTTVGGEGNEGQIQSDQRTTIITATGRKPKGSPASTKPPSEQSLKLDTDLDLVSSAWASMKEKERVVENVVKERECLLKILDCLFKDVQDLCEGKTEGDTPSSLDHIESSIERGSSAYQGLTQARGILNIQIEWKREAQFAALLLQELNDFSGKDNDGRIQNNLSEPPIQAMSANSKDNKTNQKSNKQNEKDPESRHIDQLKKDFSNASNVLQKQKVVENVVKERECLLKILDCLFKDVQDLCEGKTEGDTPSSLDHIEPSIERRSSAYHGLTQARGISNIQIEWKREAQFAALLLQELNDFSGKDNDGRVQNALSEPPRQVTSANSNDRNTNQKSSKPNGKAQVSRHAEQLNKDFSNASNVLQKQKEAEYVSCLLEELSHFSKATQIGKNDNILSEPQKETSRDIEEKDTKNIDKSRDKPPQSVHNEKLMKHYGNASDVLNQLKENEELRVSLGTKTDQAEDLRKRLQRVQDENAKLTKDADRLRTRLSEHAGALLTFENASIADLIDPNRPTKLTEKYSELYDNQWTDAFAYLSKKDPSISEEKLTGYLYEMLVDGYRFCQDVRQTQIWNLEGIMLYPADGIKSNQRRQKEEVSKIYAKNLSDAAKLSSNVTSANMAKAFVMDEKTKDKYREMIKPCETYIQECVELCWHMQVQTPPVWLDVNTVKGKAFKNSNYREYTKKGKKIAFVVWPALFLHENGPLLSKGVAQGQ